MKVKLTLSIIIGLFLCTSCSAKDLIHQVEINRNPVELQFVESNTWLIDRVQLQVTNKFPSLDAFIGNYVVKENYIYYVVNYYKKQGNECELSEIIELDSLDNKQSVVYSTESKKNNSGIPVLELIHDELFWVEDGGVWVIKKMTIDDKVVETIFTQSSEIEFPSNINSIGSCLYWYVLPSDSDKVKSIHCYHQENKAITSLNLDSISLRSPYEKVEGFENTLIVKSRKDENYLINVIENHGNTTTYSVGDVAVDKVIVNSDYVVWINDSVGGEIFVINKKTNECFKLIDLDHSDRLKGWTFYNNGIVCEFTLSSLYNASAPSNELLYFDFENLLVDRMINPDIEQIAFAWPSVFGSQMTISAWNTDSKYIYLLSKKGE